jgi:hypothetical protein
MQGAAAGPLFLSEESDCCERICLQQARPLTFNLHLGNNQEGPVFLKMKKIPHLPGCCCCRPEFDIMDGNDQYMGYVDDPCRCCTIDQRVYDMNKTMRYSITGPLCQCDDIQGVWKNTIFGPSREISYRCFKVRQKYF